MMTLPMAVDALKKHTEIGRKPAQAQIARQIIHKLGGKQEFLSSRQAGFFACATGRNIP